MKRPFHTAAQLGLACALLAALAAALLLAGLPTRLQHPLAERGQDAAEPQTGQAVTPLRFSFFATLQVADPQPVVLGAGGQVQAVHVRLGDPVEAGTVLVSLDPAHLEWNVARAEIDLELARVVLLDQGAVSAAGELAVAEANLSLAQAALQQLQEGPTDDQLAAAQANATSAWARYNELRAGPSAARLNQLRANMEKARIARDEAQRAYDEIAWRADVGRTPQAAALQRATVDYDAVLGAFEEAISPPAQSIAQAALAAAHRAQHELNQLQTGAAAAEIAIAEARVTAAEAAVKRLQELQGSSSLRIAELRVHQALINLEEALLRHDSAQVQAPVAGTILALNADVGQQVGAGSTIAVIGDVNHLLLELKVPQDQIDQIAVGDPVHISLFGSAEVVATAAVDWISPVGLASTGASSFPVTVHLPDAASQGLRPGVLVSVSFAAQ